jgi:hypothetical protein
LGYFEGLTSGSFKTAQDGRRLFFPWGVLGRGYVLASEEEYLRLRRQVKAYMVTSLLLVIFTPNLAHGYIIAGALLVLLFGFYLIWMWFLLGRLEVANEGLSWNESMASSARAHGPVVVWLLVIGSLAFVGCGILMLIVQPGSWPVALAATLFFGFCAAMAIRMLILRRRTAGVGP